jgi:DNA-binding response OmpR family regulator
MSSSHGPNGSDLKGVRVLVVEDTWHVAKALKAWLERLDMSVVGPTSTTAEARRLIAANNPRLALVDLNLKHEMADALIDELHAQGTPVIVVSGYVAPAVAKQKVVAFLQKPFNGNELTAAMCAAVRTHPNFAHSQVPLGTPARGSQGARR